MKVPSKPYTIAVIVSLMCLAVSAAIALPLVWRGFYYLHINALDLSAKTGWSYEEIKFAFDEMMDYCVWGAPFGTGVMKWSQEGFAHFADCAVIFTAVFTVLGVSLAAVLLLGHMGREYAPVKLGGYGPLFWAGVLPGVLIAAVGGLAALDFDRAFTVFHTIFFPGKSNWIFDYRVDEIILVLPQVVFRNYAILIGVTLVLLCAGLVLADRRATCRERQSAVPLYVNRRTTVSR